MTLPSEFAVERRPLPAKAETVIIGAGVMGLAIAYNLCRRGHTNVVLIERGYLAEGASGRNGGGVRQQWSTELNVRLMQASVDRCRRFAKELGVNVWFRQGGYLFLARTAAEVARLEKNVALHNRCGVGTRLIDAHEAERIVPELNPSGILAAAFNSTDGILFPWPFLWGYAQRATALGAELFTHTPVVDLERVPGGYRVVTPDGAVIAKQVINAAGAWSRELAKMLGVEVPTRPMRHEICSSEPLKPFLGPMVSELSSGLYFSQSMRGEIVGGVSLPGEPSSYDMGSSLRFLATYASRLVSLMPRLADIKVLRQWAGPYDLSPDGDPILGAPTATPGFYLACGFVGHGFMMAPIVGELYADLLLGKGRHELFDRCRLERFSESGDEVAREDFNIG